MGEVPAAVSFGDFDPEDAYDAADPIPVRLALLARIAVAIAADPDLDRAARRRLGLVLLLRTIADEVASG